MKMKKRGTSSIEMIISFAIFIAFLTAIFFFIKPIREPSVSTTTLDIAENALISNGEIVFGIVPFTVDVSEVSENCFVVQHPLKFGDLEIEEKNGILNAERVMVKNSELEDVTFNVDSVNLILPKSSEKFYYIYYTIEEDLNKAQPSTCPTILPADKYSFSVPRIEEVLSYNKLTQLKSSYNSDYEGLKREWNFPLENDFSITFSKAELNMEHEIPPEAEVFSRELDMKIFQDGEFVRVKVTLKVW
ncbi:MAG: hypothetical protein AABX59_03805 [Nanoarchaeota archaeon]